MVSWEPAADADVDVYTVSVKDENVEEKYANATSGDLSVTVNGLQEMTVYNVSVQALNCGGFSRTLTSIVRMVTIGMLYMSDALELFIKCCCTETILYGCNPLWLYLHNSCILTRK